ncbi:hypothetical protein [Luteimonas terricola]|uniref:Helix-turn-helix domain-containing protein n=1 Tax=Luteimonas terricola TaxID=645597 RepID=A0ABQ2EEA9_9GAMM|nr:hypothetical protein [Luteimonas terricola]GGK08799.1 hypothetical protein GCM10011394_17810 [Luteimonas terricola]
MPRNGGNQRSYFAFARWAIALRRPPSVKEIEGFFQISRSSAWRIQRNWMLAELDYQETIQPGPGVRQHPQPRSTT